MFIYLIFCLFFIYNLSFYLFIYFIYSFSILFVYLFIYLMYSCIHSFINRFCFSFHLSISSLLFFMLDEIYLESLCYYNSACNVLFILFDFYIIWLNFSLSLTPFYYFDYYEHQYFTSFLYHMFF